MKEYVVHKWEEFDKIVFEGSWNEDIGRHRTNLVFRGLSHRNYDLIPSLNRVCGTHLDLEQSLLRNFEKYASLDIPGEKDFWNIVSLAQHHGLPTRLLDWTFSPYIAAHFATENYRYYDQDAAIWCLDFVRCHDLLPTPLKYILKAHNANSFNITMLGSVASNYGDLKALEMGYALGAFPVFFEPPSIDSRIINQYALFSVMSDETVTIGEWLKEHDDLCFKVIIPAEAKLEFRDRLDQINMTERLIYPGLDGLCKWLTRHYTPSEKIGS